jgi:geranylgeranyl transferase type-2 subunit beta
MVDVFHTLFGVAGLSLGYPELDDLDPVYYMPASLIERMGLKEESEDASAAIGVKIIV